MRLSNPFTHLLATTLCFILIFTACSTAWIGEAEQIVAALIPAATNLVALITELQGSLSTADVQTMQSAGTQATADLQLMQSLITQYQKADATAQPGILNQIQAALSAVQSNLSSLLPALHIKDAATQAKVTALVGILISEVESVAAIVPAVNPAASPAMMQMAARQSHKRPPLPASEFVSSYNAVMTARTGNHELDRATIGLRIHVHRNFARWTTAGLLK